MNRSYAATPSSSPPAWTVSMNSLVKTVRSIGCSYETGLGASSSTFPFPFAGFASFCSAAAYDVSMTGTVYDAVYINAFNCKLTLVPYVVVGNKQNKS